MSMTEFLLEMLPWMASFICFMVAIHFVAGWMKKHIFKEGSTLTSAEVDDARHLVDKLAGSAVMVLFLALVLLAFAVVNYNMISHAGESSYMGGNLEFTRSQFYFLLALVLILGFLPGLPVGAWLERSKIRSAALQQAGSEKKGKGSEKGFTAFEAMIIVALLLIGLVFLRDCVQQDRIERNHKAVEQFLLKDFSLEEDFEPSGKEGGEYVRIRDGYIIDYTPGEDEGDWFILAYPSNLVEVGGRNVYFKTPATGVRVIREESLKGKDISLMIRKEVEDLPNGTVNPPHK